MAVLTTEQRSEVAARWQAGEAMRLAPLGSVTKGDMRAAVEVVDDWLEGAFPGFYMSFPEASRTEIQLTTMYDLLARLIARRIQVIHEGMGATVSDMPLAATPPQGEGG